VLEGHTGLLTRLLETLLPADAIDPAARTSSGTLLQLTSSSPALFGTDRRRSR